MLYGREATSSVGVNGRSVSGLARPPVNASTGVENLGGTVVAIVNMDILRKQTGVYERTWTRWSSATVFV